LVEYNFQINGGTITNNNDKTNHTTKEFVEENTYLNAIINNMGCRICGQAKSKVAVKWHLAANLQVMDARYAALEVEIAKRLLHPLQSHVAPYAGINQDETNCLARGKDFLNRGGETRSV
jgi:predicted NUDIX family NTP pyrophosphohydrolase